MEISLYEAGKKLGVTIVGKDGEFREWGAITRQMDGAIEKLPSKDEKRKWSEVRALLDHVRHCWRNVTMHPRRTYTHEEALAIFDAVKSYLRLCFHFGEPRGIRMDRAGEAAGSLC